MVAVVVLDVLEPDAARRLVTVRTIRSCFERGERPTRARSSTRHAGRPSSGGSASARWTRRIHAG